MGEVLDKINLLTMHGVASPWPSACNAFWGGKKAEEDVKLYLQVEASGKSAHAPARLSLCVKLDTTRKDDLEHLRAKWHKAVLGSATLVALDAARPRKFGSGKTMTVATLHGFPKLDDKSRIDVSATCDQMRRAEKLLEICIEHDIRSREAAECRPPETVDA